MLEHAGYKGEAKLQHTGSRHVFEQLLEHSWQAATLQAAACSSDTLNTLPVPRSFDEDTQPHCSLAQRLNVKSIREVSTAGPLIEAHLRRSQSGL